MHNFINSWQCILCCALVYISICYIPCYFISSSGSCWNNYTCNYCSFWIKLVSLLNLRWYMFLILCILFFLKKNGFHKDCSPLFCFLHFFLFLFIFLYIHLIFSTILCKTTKNKYVCFRCVFFHWKKIHIYVHMP